MVDPGGSAVAWEALSAVGRTEDLRFSPSNRRIAFAAFGHGTIAIGEAVVDQRAVPARCELTDLVELPLGGRIRPHGVDWLDDATLVIADRDGALSVARIVEDERGRPQRLEPVELTGVTGTRSPGSVRLLPQEGPARTALVCNNYAGTVTGHALHQLDGGSLTARTNEVLVERWLDVPDGVAVSSDGRWIAVSNHIPHLVMVYDRTRELGPSRDPDAVLRGVGYPHGLAFTPDGRHLVVADAGRPFVHAFAAGGDGHWAGVRSPVASVRVMDDRTFAAGRTRPQEGGPKGLDVDRTGRVVVVTSEHQPLAVLAVDDLLRPGAHPPDGEELLITELAAVADDAERRAGFEADARSALDRATQAEARLASVERQLAEAEARLATAEQRAEAAMVIAREADARARAGAGSSTPLLQRAAQAIRRRLPSRR